MFLTLASCIAIAFPFWYSCSSLPSRIWPTLTSFASFFARSLPWHSPSSPCAYSSSDFTYSHCSCLYYAFTRAYLSLSSACFSLSLTSWLYMCCRLALSFSRDRS
jgi:hypothetical protein